MTKALKILTIIFVVAAIVAASGCSGNNTQTPSPSPTVTETPSKPVSTPAPMIIPTSAAVETPNVTEKANATQIEGGNIEETENITAPEVENGTYVSPHEPIVEANPINYTTYNNSEDNTPVAPNQGTLKIIPSGTTTTQGNATAISNTLRKLQIAQNHTYTNGT